MWIARINLTYLAAVVTLVLGLLALLNPTLLGNLTGLEAVAPRGVSAIRATFGAMVLTMGGIMLWAAPNLPRSAPWLRFAGLVWLGAGAGRAASVILDGVWSPTNLAILALELALGALALQGSFPPRPGVGGRRRVAEPQRALDATRGEGP